MIDRMQLRQMLCLLCRSVCSCSPVSTWCATLFSPTSRRLRSLSQVSLKKLFVPQQRSSQRLSEYCLEGTTNNVDKHTGCVKALEFLSAECVCNTGSNQELPFLFWVKSLDFLCFPVFLFMHIFEETLHVCQEVFSFSWRLLDLG